VAAKPPAVVVPEEAAVVVAEEAVPTEAAVVAPEEAMVVAEAAVVVAPKCGLRRDESRRRGDVGWAHGGGCCVGRGCGTEQKRAGDGACAHCACC
jgi:hypothetical protein